MAEQDLPKQETEPMPMRRNLWREERGAAAVYFTLVLPVFVGLLALGSDGAHGLYMRNLLQATAESAALAATSELPRKAESTIVAKNYAELNMPSARYGQVLRDEDVVLGFWTEPSVSGCSGMGCFAPATGASGQDCGSAQCNAVMVTTRRTASSGNPLGLTFAQYFGGSSLDVVATAIATFGRGQGGTPTWDMAVVQDISASFTRPQYVTNPLCLLLISLCPNAGVLPQAKAANQTLLDCMRDYAAPGSRFGITVHTGGAAVHQTPIAVTDPNNPESETNYNTLKNKVNTIPQCSASGATSCSSGTGIDAGINTTRTVYSSLPAPPPGSQRAMIIVSDGEPNRCNGNSCTAQQARTAAENAANAAWQEGISIYTICYRPGGSCAPNEANWMANLTRGDGIALNTPSPEQLSEAMQKVCASGMRHKLVW